MAKRKLWRGKNSQSHTHIHSTQYKAVYSTVETTWFPGLCRLLPWSWPPEMWLLKGFQQLLTLGAEVYVSRFPQDFASCISINVHPVGNPSPDKVRPYVILLVYLVPPAPPPPDLSAPAAGSGTTSLLHAFIQLCGHNDLISGSCLPVDLRFYLRMLWAVFLLAPWSRLQISASYPSQICTSGPGRFLWKHLLDLITVQSFTDWIQI